MNENISMSKDDNLTAEFVRQILDYDPETGILTWKWRSDLRACDNARLAGKNAGCLNENGYFHIIINKKSYKYHRIIWLHYYGEWPYCEIDHIDGDTINNKIINIRSATRTQNRQNKGIQKNNTSGFKGVSFKKAHNKWSSRISVNGRRVHLGYFDRSCDAYNAYCAAAERFHGEFARTR